jgi:hypothetical protein
MVVVALALLIPSSSFAGPNWGLIGSVLEGVNQGLNQAQEMQIRQQQIELQKIEIERQRIGLERERAESTQTDLQETQVRAESSRQWTQYAKDKKGNIFYYDKASRALVGGQYAAVREWVECSPDGGGSQNLRQIWRTSVINCRDGLIKLGDFLTIDNKGQVRQSPNLEWKTIPVGSVWSILSTKICINTEARPAPETDNMDHTFASVSNDIRGKYALKTFRVEDAKGLVITEKDVSLSGTLELRDNSYRNEISFANKSTVMTGTYSLSFDTPVSGRAVLRTERGTSLAGEFEILDGGQLTFHYKQTSGDQTHQEWDNWIRTGD